MAFLKNVFDFNDYFRFSLDDLFFTDFLEVMFVLNLKLSLINLLT